MTRTFCAALVLMVFTTLTACTSTNTEDAAGDDVVVVDGYGAEYAELFQEQIAKPFTKETGIRVEFRDGGSAAERYTAIRASQGDPGFDVGVATNLELYQGSKDKLLAPLTPEQVPNLAKLPKKLRDNTYGVGAIQDVQQLVLMYNKELFPQAPSSWDVMWKPKYRSGALIYNPENVIGVYMMLLGAELDGGGIDDTDPGFSRIAELARYALATPTTSAEAVPYMEKSTASAFPYLDARAAIYAKTTNFDYTVPREGSYASLGSVSVPVGADHKQAAYEFIDYWLSPEVQLRWAKAYNVGPALPGLDLPDGFAAKHVVSASQLDEVRIADAATVVQNRTAWGQRWAEAVR